VKTKVRVTLRSECEVELEVEHGPDESPTDLTKEEVRRARAAAGVTSSFDIVAVEVVES
jgi:hypothetical protein